VDRVASIKDIGRGNCHSEGSELRSGGAEMLPKAQHGPNGKQTPDNSRQA
jgi:hypothetical protein